MAIERKVLFLEVLREATEDVGRYSQETEGHFLRGEERFKKMYKGLEVVEVVGVVGVVGVVEVVEVEVSSRC